jgi:hypothetical protein
MNVMKFTAMFMLILVTSIASAQSGKIEMADAMRESGKIYVVIAVLCSVFAGLIMYATLIDRRLSKLEKEVNKK